MSNANESAFPETFTDPKISKVGKQYGDVYSVGGLTKREYFAGLAMQGALSSEINYAPKEKSVFPGLAEVCVRFADALLAELDKTK